MSSIVISGDSSGQVSLTVPAVAGNNTATLPAATGTVMVSGNMPAFSAYLGNSQTVTSGVATKMQINTKVFDTANNFDNVTNYRFTPTVAGYYQVNGHMSGAASVAMTSLYVMIYKNGSISQYGTVYQSTSGAFGANAQASTVSSLIFMNGSTDYIELYGLIGGTGTCTFNTSSGQISYFQASLVRAA